MILSLAIVEPKERHKLNTVFKSRFFLSYCTTTLVGLNVDNHIKYKEKNMTDKVFYSQM